MTYSIPHRRPWLALVRRPKLARVLLLLGAGALAAGSRQLRAEPQEPAAAGAPRASGAPTTRVQQPRGEPLLRIGGREIGADEFGRWMIDNLGSRMARSFGADWIVERDAERRGATVSAEEIQSHLDAEIAARIQGAFLGKKEDWVAELTRTERTEQGYRAQRALELEPELLARAVVSIDRVVPEEVLQREWELRYGRNGRKYDVLLMKFQCVFLSPEGEQKKERDVYREAEIQTQLERAQAARERLLAGADFGTLAAQLSDDPTTRDHRGELPAGFSHFGWPKNFLDALDELAPGQISEPVYARGGWWLVRVEKVAVTPLEDVRAPLVQELLVRGPDQLEVGQYRAGLEAAMTVKVLPSLFEERRVSDETPESVPALEIDGETVSRSTYALWLLRMRGEASARHFAEHWVVKREAQSLGISVTEEEVRARAEDYIRMMIQYEHKGSRDAWRAQLARGGREEDSFLRDLMVRMRIEALTEKLMRRERVITPERVRARWTEIYGTDGRLVQARLLLLRVPLPPEEPPLNREELDRKLAELSAGVRQRMEDLARRVKEGEDFATLARKYSEEPSSAAEGGLLPDRFRPERWPKDVSDAVQALQPGEATPALDLKSAWAIFQVVSAKQVRFEDVEKDLREQLEREPIAPSDLAVYRNVLLKRTKVEVLPAMAR
jgi:parvulin-like peptidyl-prolyl isomerase